MRDNKFSRRHLIGTGLGAAATAAFVSAAGVNTAEAAGAGDADSTATLFQVNDAETFAASLENAYSFLDLMMDAYAQGSTIRLVQSSSDQAGLPGAGSTIHAAFLINAYLLRGRGEDLARAQILGNSLLYAQQHDPNFTDGRLRAFYEVDKPDTNGAFIGPLSFLNGSVTGDQAWAGMALAQLYNSTGASSYLNGAIKLGKWIVNNTFDSRGAGGYTTGSDAANSPFLHKQTEYNIDAFALFVMLARLTGDVTWADRAEHARNFVNAMFNGAGGFFWTGTGTDGITINQSNIPELPQTWSFLAFLDRSHAVSLDWDKTNLATTDTPQTINSSLKGNIRIYGSTFADASLRALTPAQFGGPGDPNAVWLEANGHLAAALLARMLPPAFDLDGFHGDLDTARMLLDNMRVAQDDLGKGQTVGGKAIPDGQGIVAASSVLNTGLGFTFNPFRELGATTWYAIARQAGNPFQVGLRAG
jgi:hypothetical protein